MPLRNNKSCSLRAAAGKAEHIYSLAASRYRGALVPRQERRSYFKGQKAPLHKDRRAAYLWAKRKSTHAVIIWIQEPGGRWRIEGTAEWRWQWQGFPWAPAEASRNLSKWELSKCVNLMEPSSQWFSWTLFRETAGLTLLSVEDCAV